MKRLLLIVLIVATSVAASDFQTGTLVSSESFTYGTSCNPGLIVAVHCSQKTTPLYSVNVEGRSYKLHLATPDVGWAGDPLHDVQLGGAFAVRFDHNQAFVRYTNKRGKSVETVYVVVAVAQ